MNSHKKYFHLMLISAGILVLVSALVLGASGDDHQNISVEEVKEKIESEKNDYILIDVRTLPEYTGPLGHLADAPLYPIQNLNSSYKDLEKYQETGKDLILYCRSGNRSNQAAKLLTEKGFENVYNMEGGMREWNQKYGRPEGSDNPPPNKTD